MRRILAASLFWLFGASLALAASTINPTQPAANSKLESAPVRNNFLAAYNDITKILGKYAGSTAPGNPVNLQDWVDTSTSPTYVFKIYNAQTSSWVSVATLNINTGVYTVLASSGSFAATAPLTVSVSLGVATYGLSYDSNFAVNGSSQLALASAASGRMLANCTGASAEPGACTWDSFANVAIGNTNGMLPYRSGGSWTTISTGTSGATIPRLDTANTWSTTQTMPSPVFTGTATGVNMTLSGALTVTGSFTATGLVPLGALADQAANTVLANVTNSTGPITAYGMPSCTGPANALQWASGTGFGCAAITAAAGSMAVGTTTITSGTSGRVLYDNAGVLGELTVTGSGNAVLATSPTIASPTFSGTVAGAGTIPNSVLVNSSTTVNGTTCTLGSTCTITATAGTITVGTTAVASGTDQFVLYNNAGTLGDVGTSGTGLVARVTSPSFTTPSLGVATGTSLALNGCTIGANGLCVTGSAAISSTLTSAAITVTSASSTALVVGANGATNPAFQVDASTASVATGIKIAGAAAASGAALSVISSGVNENLSVDAKGSGTITLGGTSTGSVTVSRALTYGGVTLSNAVTGTGNMVLSASPTLSGTLAAAIINQTSSSSACHTIGPNGSTNPVMQIDCSTASAATGIKITGAAAAAGVAIAAISSGTNEAISINAKGSGAVALASTSTGGVTFGAAGSVVGQAVFYNATSGSITVQPTTGALGTRTLTLPAVTDTLAGQSIANGGTGGSLTASNGGIVYSDASRLQLLAGTGSAGQCLLSGANAAPSWGSCAGGAAVSSVSNSDGTLTVSPTTGAVVASLDLTHANTWTGVQSFTASGIKLKGSSTGYTTFASANAGASNYTATFQAANGTVAYLDLASQTISGGATVTSLSQSTGNITVDCGARPLQYITNGGAYTITAPSADGSCMLLVTNNASAGATTFSGFTVGSSTGDSLTTTNTNKFVITIVRINGTSTYLIKALQ